MPYSLIDVLRASVDEIHTRMRALEDGAVADGRDSLNGAEQAAWDDLRAEMAAKTQRLGDLIGRAELDAQVGVMMGRGGGSGQPSASLGKAGSEFPYRTPGEYALAYIRSKRDAGEAARFTRALADVTTAQTPGLVPAQVTGDILGQWMGGRPSVDAMSRPPLPPVGMEVQRPRITQHTEVAEHVEKQAVASQAFQLDLLKIPVESWAGGVDVSWELANRSSPGALDIIFADLVSVYARRSNTAAWAAVAAQVAQAVAWDGTAGALAAALSAAAILAAGSSTSNSFPDVMWLGLEAYAALAGLSDSTGRPLFPGLGPANAPGTATATGTISAVQGMAAVVDPLIPADTFVIGNHTAVEFYETPDAPAQLSVVDVGVAGYDIGVIGMWAVQAVDPGALVKITLPAPEGTRTASPAKRAA